jgi:L-2-hydroxyglutarate oxidase LhgO
VVIIGAGVVGLSLAYRLAHAGCSVIVLERESRIGTHSSSRNSEVIHAGLYYAPGSLKARLCVRGRELLYAFCAEREVPHARIGKLIVATDESQLPALGALKARGELNGVLDLKLLGEAESRALEPALRVVGALHSPSTGILDSHAFMGALERGAREKGAVVATRTPFLRAERSGGGFCLEFGGADAGSVACAVLINAAGLFAPEVARGIKELAPEHVPEAYYAKGHYFTLSGASPFSHLVYPLPDAHGLGTHVTLDLAGQVRFGPDVCWIDAVDYSFEPGRAGTFLDNVRRYYPGLDASRVQQGYTGIRPKLTGPSGAAQDFVVRGPDEHGVAGLINLFGIESPGLTSCLALADLVCERLAR